METPDHHRPYLDRIPIGTEIDFETDGIPGWEIFPFLGDLDVKILDPPQFPEPARHGEDGGPCFGCDNDDAIWSNDDWKVSRLGEPSAVPVCVVLAPIEHFDLPDLPSELAASMGTMLARLAAAIETVPGVGRAHLHKWGDGGAHLHWFGFGRPAGMQQLRGSCLVLWEDVLPKMPEEMWQQHLQIVADHLASTE